MKSTNSSFTFTAPSKKVSTPRKFNGAPNLSTLSIDVSAIAPAKPSKANAAATTHPVASSSVSSEEIRPRKNKLFSEDDSLTDISNLSSLSALEIDEIDPCDLYAIYLQNLCLAERAKTNAYDDRVMIEEQLLQEYSLYNELRTELGGLTLRLNTLKELKEASENKEVVEPLMKKIADVLESMEDILMARKETCDDLSGCLIIKETEPVGSAALADLAVELETFCNEVRIPQSTESLVTFATGRKDILLASKDCLSLIERVSRLTDRSSRLRNMEELSNIF